MADSSGHSDTQGKGIAHPRRVAVIGVHGVARHQPGATANAMADLLLSLPSFDRATEQMIQMGVWIEMVSSASPQRKR